MSSLTPRSKHLPYTIDPEKDRFAYYESHWKRTCLSLLIKHCSPSGQTVLDYGCGRGETLQYFGEAGFQVTGTDVDSECVRLASRFGAATLLRPEDPLAQFGARSFDIVTCFHVLEHVENPKQTLGALAKLARQFVLVAVPNLRYLHQITVRHFELSHVNEGHLQAWDHLHFLNLATNYCGLELVEWGSDATILPLVSGLAQKLIGTRATIALETGLFRRLFPYHCISVMGLFKVKE